MIFSFFPAGRRLARLFPVVAALALGGCTKEASTTAPNQAQIEAQKKIDNDLISAYVTAQGLRAVRRPSGLTYVKIDSAAAAEPLASAGKRATVNYYGKLLNGTADGSQFDSSYSRGTPFSFVVGRGEVIAGWDEAVALMRKGDRWRVIIPSHLGYGASRQGPIPANAVLVFYMKLENVQ